MNTPENLLAFRQACQRANIRTIGCEFDGSGDEGYVNMVGVLEITLNGETTTVSAQSLDDLKDSIPIIGLMSRQRYNYANNSWDTCAEAERLHDLATTHSVNLDSVFYNVLHNFPGDWINNSGGYGQAYLDLVTGQYSTSPSPTPLTILQTTSRPSCNERHGTLPDHGARLGPASARPCLDGHARPHRQSPLG